MDEWQVQPLKSFVDPSRSICYGIVQPGAPVDGGVPILRVNNFTGSGLDISSAIHVAEAIERDYKRSRLNGGELLITLVGSLGLTAIAPEEMKGWNVARAVGVIPLAASADVRWINFVLRSRPAQDFMAMRANTTVQATFNLKDLAELPIPMPPDDVRRPMSELLSALDDKIELNRRMNETLEAIARAIYSLWLEADDDLRERVSVSALQKSGVLAIGDGYRAKNQELGGIGLPFIRAGELKSGFDTDRADILNEISVAKAADKRSRAGDVAFTSKGTIGRFARVTHYTPELVYSPQVCFWRSLDDTRLRPSLLFMWMTSQDLRSQIDAVSGNTDMAPYVSLADQKRMNLPVFGDDQHAIADKLDLILEKQAHNDFESRRLAATRDALLPKLMSGELRVRGAEALAA